MRNLFCFCTILGFLLKLDAFAQSPAFTLDVSGAEQRVLDITVSENESAVRFSVSGLKAVAVTGAVDFYNNNSYARIILVDKLGHEHLIYQVSAFLSGTGVQEFKNASEETQRLPNIESSHIRVDLQDAKLRIEKVQFFTGNYGQNLRLASDESIRYKQAEEKVRKVKAMIRKKGLKWQAGITSVALLTYEQKKILFQGKLPNLQGAEFYKGGIFVMGSSAQSSSGNLILSEDESGEESPYVEEFDWRNRHGQNWCTSVKTQSYCGSCWAFSATASTEQLVNLYYNRHVDLNLSEQDLVSCSESGTCQGGWPYKVVDYIKFNGVVNESCFPYSVNDASCEDKCLDPQERISFGKKQSFIYKSEDALKAMVIKGPVTSGIYSWKHAVSLVGYRKIKEGDVIFKTNEYAETIQPGDPLIGKTLWIFKNSWGEGWGENGYLNLVADIHDIGFTYGLSGPVTSLNYTNADIQCTDLDGDGYYFWGIGPKPSHCPPCPDQPDGDDSNPALGPLDKYGHCLKLESKGREVVPVVTLVSPENNTVFPASSVIELLAAAWEEDGEIKKVDFYADSSLIGSSVSEPYTITWANPLPGTYKLTAKAVDGSGNSKTSSSVIIEVKNADDSGTGHNPDVVTAVEKSAAKLEIAPNPVQHILRVKTHRGTEPNVEVYSPEGIQVGIRVYQEDDATVLDVSSLNPGLYTIVVKDKKSVRRGHFLKSL